MSQDPVRAQPAKDLSASHMFLGRELTQCRGQIRARQLEACEIRATRIEAGEIITNQILTNDINLVSTVFGTPNNFATAGTPLTQGSNLSPVGPTLTSDLFEVLSGNNPYFVDLPDAGLNIGGPNNSLIIADASSAGYYHVDMQLRMSLAVNTPITTAPFSMDIQLYHNDPILGTSTLLEDIETAWVIFTGSREFAFKLSGIVPMHNGTELGLAFRVGALGTGSVTPSFNVVLMSMTRISDIS